MNQTVLVAGVSGITGSYIARHLSQTNDFAVIGLSRSPGPAGIRTVAGDLLDPAQLNTLAPQMSGVTHVVYAAFAGDGGKPWSALTAMNTAMFGNVLDALERHAHGLQRIVLLQGQKVYGTHLGPYQTPSRESDPRHSGENFYFTQQDILAARSTNSRWDYVCLRPHVVCGHNWHSPQNPIAVLAQYAMLSRLQGLALHFPGDPQAFDKLYQATDATLLGEAAHWALQCPQAGGEAFNVVNGDYFRWSQLWPVIADVFDMECGTPRPQDLTRTMAAPGAHFLPAWPAPDWAFANYLMGSRHDVMAAMTKARQFGFEQFRDSFESLRSLLAQARDALAGDSTAGSAGRPE